MNLDWGFPKRVTREESGAYYWTYDLKAHGNNEPLWFMLKICLAVAVPIDLIMLMLTWEYGPGQALLWNAIFLAGMVGLPALIWKLLPPNPSFRMDDKEIEAWPKGRGQNIHAFKDVRRVSLRPDTHCIILKWHITALHVYVPPEDYGFVRDFIIAHVPEGVEMRYNG